MAINDVRLLAGLGGAFALGLLLQFLVGVGVTRALAVESSLR